MTPLVLGQLKAIGGPFYQNIHRAVPAWLESERTLNEMPDTGTFYPWTLTLADDVNLAYTTTGQVKAVFSLRFENLAAAVSIDSDSDGLSDGWERFYFADLNQTAAGDFDLDGLSNIWEFSNGTNPATVMGDRDSDNDNLPDDWERYWFRSLDEAGSGDPDEDGLTNYQEYSLLSNPANPDSDGDGMGDGFEIYYGLLINSNLNEVGGLRRGPDDDKDFDGKSNKSEWALGSIPNNSSEEPAYSFAPPTLHWYGVSGHVYFVQWTTNYTIWNQSPQEVKGENKGISLLVQDVVGGPPLGSFASKLKIYSAELDSDSDGIPDWFEIEKLGTDPFDKNSAGGDSNTNGLPDGWELFHFGGLGIANPSAVLQPDGLTNKEKAELGLDPDVNYSAPTAVQKANYTHNNAGRLTGVTAAVGTASFTPDEEGNITNAH